MRFRTTMRLHTLFILWIVSILLFANQMLFGTETDDIKFFESNIRPLLVERCVTCHQSGKAMSGLQLDSHEGLLKGGKRGSVINLEHPNESLLLKAISHQDETLKMPPGKKLEEAEFQLLTEWALKGAPWTTATPNESKQGNLSKAFTQADRDFWLFQPIQEPPIPKTDDNDWAKNPIDRFIYQKLNDAGLQPADEAEKRVLIRRA